MKQLIVTGLPTRQAEALLHTANGMTRKEAARRMGCSPQNVAQLMTQVSFKLHARNAAEAVANGFRVGVLRLMSLILILSSGALVVPSPAGADEMPVLRSARVRQTSRSTRQLMLSSAASAPAGANPFPNQ